MERLLVLAWGGLANYIAMPALSARSLNPHFENHQEEDAAQELPPSEEVLAFFRLSGGDGKTRQPGRQSAGQIVDGDCDKGRGVDAHGGLVLNHLHHQTPGQALAQVEGRKDDEIREHQVEPNCRSRGEKETRASNGAERHDPDPETRAESVFQASVCEAQRHTGDEGPADHQADGAAGPAIARLQQHGRTHLRARDGIAPQRAEEPAGANQVAPP